MSMYSDVTLSTHSTGGNAGCTCRYSVVVVALATMAVVAGMCWHHGSVAQQLQVTARPSTLHAMRTHEALPLPRLVHIPGVPLSATLPSSSPDALVETTRLTRESQFAWSRLPWWGAIATCLAASLAVAGALLHTIRDTQPRAWSMAAIAPGPGRDALNADYPLLDDDDIRVVDDAFPGEWVAKDMSVRSAAPDKFKWPSLNQDLIQDPWQQVKHVPEQYVGALGDLVRQDLSNIASGIYRAPYDQGSQSTPSMANNVFDHVTNLLQPGSQPLNSKDPCMDMIQRQVLVPLHNFMEARCQEDTELLEVGCGSGRLHAFIKDNYPMLCTTAADSSLRTLTEALLTLATLLVTQRAHGRVSTDPTFILAKPHTLPFDRESFDVVVLRFALAGLSPSEQEAAVAHACRVVRPGGQLIILDHVQACDHRVGVRPSAIPAEYWEANILEMFEGAGVKLESQRYALETKVMSFRKANVTDLLTASVNNPSLNVELSLPRS